MDTRVFFANALEELLKTRGFNKITVEDIAKECGSSRTTFYRYFKDKHDLVGWMHLSAYNTYARAHGCDIDHYVLGDNWRFLGECIFATILENPQFYRKVVEYEGQNSLLKYLFETNVESFETSAKKLQSIQELPQEMTLDIRFYYAGLSYIVYQWIRTGMKESPKCMQSICERNLSSSMRVFFN